MTYNLYKVLGLDANDRPNDNDIRKAYKKMAMKYHPDKNKDNPDAEAKFKEISNAYETLCDPKKKQIYDQVGDEGFKEGNNDFEHDMRGDIFQQFFNRRSGPFADFGFNFGGFDNSHQEEKQNKHQHKQFNVTLEDVFNGIQKGIGLNVTKYCFDCMKKCENCQGSGMVKQIKNLGVMTQIFTGSCHVCSGSGYKIDGKKSCSTCSGKGKYQKEFNAFLNLPKGIHNGYSTVFEGMGEQPKNPQQKASDLILEIKIQDHNIFKRNHNDLIYKCSITFIESIIGKELTIPYFHKPFTINTNTLGVVYPNKQYTIKDKGLPILGTESYGNMMIEFDIKYPKIKNTEKVKELESLLKETFGE